MKLEQLLSQKGPGILGKWLNLALETYPADAHRFLKKQKDRFANPVGTTIEREIKSLYKELLREIDPERVSPILDRIVRIRAVQEFSPSQAVAFIFSLKYLVRRELEKELRENELFDDLPGFEARVDEVGLLAFDIYMKCREKLYEIRAREARAEVSGLLRKAGMIGMVPVWKAGIEKDNGG